MQHLSRLNVEDFEKIKEDIAKASLAAIDENLPFIVECDASDVAVAATLNLGGRPVAFMSRTLHPSERHYPAVEKRLRPLLKRQENGIIFLLEDNTLWLQTNGPSRLCLIAKSAVKSRTIKLKAGDLN